MRPNGGNLMAAIKDVARLAGVSASAVSKYFKMPDKMREETRRKIAAAVAELNFQPNQLARSLRNGRSGLIALTVPDILNPYFSQYTRLMQQCCNDVGFVPLLVQVSEEKEQQKAVQLLNSGLVDGVICSDGGPFVQMALKSGLQIPLVQITPDADALVKSTVVIDLAQGMALLCAHLAQQGVKTAGFIGTEGDFSAEKKLTTVRQYCACHEMEIPDEAVVMAPLNAQVSGYVSGYDACRQLLRQTNALPDALICSSDIWMIGALRCLTEKGIRVPADILITGHDDTELAEMSNPSVTSVRIPLEQLCPSAVELLHQMLDGGEARSVTIPTGLTIRASTQRVNS